jgi:hypothetical protein
VHFQIIGAIANRDSIASGSRILNTLVSQKTVRMGASAKAGGLRRMELVERK